PRRRAAGWRRSPALRCVLLSCVHLSPEKSNPAKHEPERCTSEHVSRRYLGKKRLLEELVEHAGDVADHRDRTPVGEPSRTDHAYNAEHLAGPSVRCYHNAAVAQPLEWLLLADSHVHALGAKQR